MTITKQARRVLYLTMCMTPEGNCLPILAHLPSKILQYNLLQQQSVPESLGLYQRPSVQCRHNLGERFAACQGRTTPP